jgi:hypothetical protein
MYGTVHVVGWHWLQMRAPRTLPAGWLLSHDKSVFITLRLPSLSFSLMCCKLPSAFEHSMGTSHLGEKNSS